MEKFIYTKIAFWKQAKQRTAILRDVLIEHLGEVVGAIHIVPRKVDRHVARLDVGLRAKKNGQTYSI
jgi:hypothetical protein